MYVLCGMVHICGCMCCDEHCVCVCDWREEKHWVLAEFGNWINVCTERTKEKGKNHLKDTYLCFILVFNYACNIWLWFTLVTCDLWYWFMMVELWPNQMWYVYTRWFSWRLGLTTCDRKWTDLQVYLIDEAPMRYDLNLVQFILNLMVVICLVQESKEILIMGCWKCPLGWLKLTARISNRKRNYNMQHYVGKGIQEQGHYGMLVPNSVH